MDARAGLLRYRPVDDLYEDWLARITELVSAAGGSPLPSLLLPRPPSYAGGEEQEMPPPPPPQGGPWLQGAQAQGEILRVRRLRSKKGAAKRSLVPKKVLARSQHLRAKIASLHLHAKAPLCSKRRRAVIPMTKPSTSKRHRWP